MVKVAPAQSDVINMVRGKPPPAGTAEKKSPPAEREIPPSVKVGTKLSPEAQQLCKELQLEERYHLKGNKQRLARVEALIERWKDVFTNDNIKVGKTSRVDPFHIELEPNTNPVRQRSRPLTPEQVQALRKPVSYTHLTLPTKA